MTSPLPCLCGRGSDGRTIHARAKRRSIIGGVAIPACVKSNDDRRDVSTAMGVTEERSALEVRSTIPRIIEGEQ